MTEHLSDFELDGIRIEASDAEHPHLSDCGECKARYEILLADANSFARDFDAGALADATLAAVPSGPTSPRWHRPALALASVAAFAAAVLVLNPDTTRTKGRHSVVETFVVDEHGQPQGMPGVLPVDAQLAVRATVEKAQYVRILWESGPKDYDALYPPAEESAWLVAKTQWLPHKITIDNAGDGRLVAVICDGPVSHEDAVQQMSRGGPCTVSTMRLTRQ